MIKYSKKAGDEYLEIDKNTINKVNKLINQLHNQNYTSIELAFAVLCIVDTYHKSDLNGFISDLTDLHEIVIGNKNL